MLRVMLYRGGRDSAIHQTRAARQALQGKVMAQEELKSKSLKAKIRHEFEEMLLISAFFGLFFFSFATYKMFLLHQFENAQFTYISALINTLVLAKVILLGGFVRAGKAMDHRPLLISAVYKAAFFALLVGAFHWIEEFVKAIFHVGSFRDALRETLRATSWPLLGLVVICFCLFIPFFSLWEVRRVMGEGAFSELFVRKTRPKLTVSH
jgi:hypothetical protein